jgi:uncharacterized protein YeeX (DUF496 family)
MADYRKLTFDQLEALKVAVIDDLVEKASISTNDVRSMSGLPRLSKETRPVGVSPVSASVPMHAGGRVSELPQGLFEEFDDKSYSRLSQLTTGSRSSGGKSRGKSKSRGDDEEVDDDDDVDDVDEEEEGSDHYLGGGGGGDDGDDSDDDGSGSYKPKSKKSAPKPTKGMKSKDAVAKATADKGEEYKKRFSTVSKVQDNDSFKVNGTYDGEIAEGEEWRYKTIEFIVESCKLRVESYVSAETISKLSQGLVRHLDGMKLVEFNKKEAITVNLTNEAGRAVAKYLRDGMAFCTIININVIQAILDVNFPLEVYIELTRKEAQRAAAAVKELEIKGVSYRGRQCSTKDELGREPTLADVETERSSMYTQLEIKLQREYRRARQKAEDENKPTKYLDKLSDAFEEKMGQVKEGFIRDVTAEFEERLEEYQSGIKQLNSLQSQLQKKKGSLQATMKLQSLFECIQYFLQTMFVKLKGSMNHQEIYTKVQETLNKKVKLIGSTTEVLTPFNEGNIFGIWANVTQHYLKATIPL